MTKHLNDGLRTAYQMAKYIHQLVDSRPGAMKCSWKGHFRDGPNPFQNQMKQGFILEEYYGTPNKIYTPLGYWTVLGGGSGDYSEVMNNLKETLGLKVIREGEQTLVGYYGPYYEITKWEGMPLPEAKQKEKDEYIPYEKAKEIFEEFRSTVPEMK